MNFNCGQGWPPKQFMEVTPLKNIRIITDDASDITKEQAEELNILLLHFNVSIGDKSYTTGVDFDNEGFYKLMDESPNEIPLTSQITVFQLDEVYKQQYDEGYDEIIYVTLNKKGSATYDNAVLAANQFAEAHPECAGKMGIHVFDGVGYSGYYGWPVLEAAKKVKEGASLADVLNHFKTTLPKRRIYFGIYTLKYAAKSGRIPSAAALVGEAFGIKPIMKIWDNEISTAIKCRGEKKLINKIVETTVAEMVPGSPYQVIYGSDAACRDELASKMTEALGYPPTDIFQIGAVIAANAGPRIVGTSFDAKE